ncbi:MAG: helix-turn-helix transcriptional regulator [Phycisphaerales bacterium]|jgi:transcriptional regulator with XRE-family HTH domain
MQITLKQARTRAGLTQVALAEKSGVRQNNISRLETGHIPNPHLDTVLRLASALRVDPRHLRFGLVDREGVA